MKARAALFDVYGDHLRSRGGRASIAALVRLMAPLGFAPPAVRTAVSRMVRQGWLKPVRLAQGPGYAVTPKTIPRLTEAAARIYRTEKISWDGRWHVLVIQSPRDRSQRDRVRASLGYLGYAPLADDTWVGPHVSPELGNLITGEKLRVDAFHAALAGDQDSMVRRAWDLDALGAAYDQWLDAATSLVSSLHDDAPDEEAFAVRSRLVHEWRKFLFEDPGLPADLLPPGWPGEKARTFFETEAARLLPRAAAFVDRCLRD